MTCEMNKQKTDFLNDQKETSMVTQKSNFKKILHGKNDNATYSRKIQ